MSGAGDLYDECLGALSDLIVPLSPDELTSTVPASPQWNVRQVVAHLAGVSSDNVHQRMDGAPGADWTARHVAERAAMPVADLLAELRAHRDQMTQLADAATVPAMVWDISVHLSDLHESLGRGRPDPSLWEPVLEQAAAIRLADLPVTVLSGDRRWGGAGDEVKVEPYELFRALFSRRSRSQIHEWGAALGEHVDAICWFGPRDDDQPRPS